jgi:cleavage stimulation factor subunit 3
LNYIRRVNPVEGDKAAASRAIIISAYDFSLNHIGIDRQSGQIWLDYINIVKAGEVHKLLPLNTNNLHPNFFTGA